jgi:ketosteroid isomerase-like protein
VTNTETITQQVLAYEDRRRAAIVSRDLEALDQLLSDDLAYVHSNGVVDTKDEYLTVVKDHTFNSIDHEFIRIKINGNLAILTAITTIDARKDSDATILAGSIRTINVWELVGSDWQQIHWQAAKVNVEQ